jgi:ElaB/YqjD/DUF883 family membrane-anchored ribosome-binding protein
MNTQRGNGQSETTSSKGSSDAKAGAPPRNVKDGASQMREQLDAVMNDAARLVSIADATASTATESVRTQLRDSPYLTLGTAAGLGFLLGGGLTPGAMGVLVSTGLRLGAAYLIRTAMRDVSASGK